MVRETLLSRVRRTARCVADRRRPGGPLFYAPVPEPTIKTAVEAMSLAVLNVLAAAR